MLGHSRSLAVLVGGGSLMSSGPRAHRPDAAAPRWLFDERDRELLRIVRDLARKGGSRKDLKSLLYPYLHPRGIKELAAPRALRIAYAIVHLLESLEGGTADDRLRALRAVQDEVLASADSHLHRNTARVLLQIMKELVRSCDDSVRLLQLAHDFRAAASGRPRVVRALLRRYHLLEMPEAWNQLAFDDHVHDSHTKGRKTPCHLIMDAWIKGIRYLTVIHYNHVGSEAAAELLEAAEIMGIDVRIGVELSARFHDRYVQLIWVPRGFADAKDFLSFLSEPHVQDFMREGRKVSQYQQQYVLAVLRLFNATHRVALGETYGIELGVLEEAEFLAFVGPGQASILHLGKFIHLHVSPLLRAQVEALRARERGASADERRRIGALVAAMDALDSEEIVERYLRPSCNPSIPDPHVPRDGADVPHLLTLSPGALLAEVGKLRSGHRITLNLSELQVEDVLELLYECRGGISFLEIFNLKDYLDGKSPHLAEIAELQRAINEANVVTLKRLIRGIIERVAAQGSSAAADRAWRLTEILRNIALLQSYYRNAPLQTRIGSDSSGHSRRFHGMGLAIQETLPRRAQREIARRPGSRLVLPVVTPVFLRETHLPRQRSASFWGSFPGLASFSPRLERAGPTRRDWVVAEPSTRLSDRGNVVSLGGVREEHGNGFSLHAPPAPPSRVPPWEYLNGTLKSTLKVLVGFVPAFATFALTKDWWVLAYLGAAIWFGVTGLRVILQSVLGAGGIRRSPLVVWKSYVRWDRLSDSLLFTGFSVPLLDYVMKTVVLDRTLGITTRTNPAALYAAMACANGLYIAAHTSWRGFPRAAVLGNLFRSVLSIPIAVALHASLGAVLGGVGAADVAATLQKWAAVISKVASDCVAGVIEGLADRYTNMRVRVRDYTVKLRQLFNVHAQLELLYPETDVLRMLRSPKQFIRKIDAEARDLEKVVIVNALDLFYFWMYQPRARGVLRSIVRTMSQDERQILVRSQFVLQRKREVTQLFVDGLVGKKFAPALALYLDYSSEYLDAIEALASEDGGDRGAPGLEGARNGLALAEPAQVPRYSESWPSDG
jgi:hypothetical protein